MPDPVDLGHAIGLRPEAAIDYFRSKGYRLTGSWRDVWQEAQATAFSVSKVARMDLLSDIRNGVLEALREGKTEQWFEKELTPVLQAKGWWGRQIAVGQDGGAEVQQLGSPARLRLIYRQNLQTSYMVGRYRSMKESADTHPFWMYVAVRDLRTRPAHAALDGRAYRHDDPIWDSVYPPNGFNCRCRVRALSQADLDRKKIEADSSDGQRVSKVVDAGLDKRTGEIIRARVDGVTITGRDGKPTDFFPDAGFSYNSGLAWSDVAAWQKAQDLSPSQAPDILRDLLLAPTKMAAYEAWVDRVLTERKPARDARVVGYMAPADREFLTSKGTPAGSGAIVLEDRLLAGAKADRHEREGDGLTAAEWKQLPRSLSSPQAVLWDGNAMLYVIPGADPRRIKVVVKMNKTLNSRASVEAVKSAFKVSSDDLSGGVKGGQYVIVRGKL